MILASASPRRRELLASLGLDFEVVPSQAPEPPPMAGERPDAYALRLARAKALDVAAPRPGALVIGADTIVVLGDRVLGKPRDAADAMATLTRLAGRTHVVITACCLAGAGGAVREFAVETRVRLAHPGQEALAAYAAGGEPLDKAGSYAIQGAGAFLVERIEGSPSNVIGLPLKELAAALVELEAIRPASPGPAAGGRGPA
nr:Maf family protein [Dissulfurirhabdus thermomarina]